MGGTRCAISTCNNTYTKAKKEGSLLSLHSFPRDGQLREHWIAACRRGDKWNPQSSHICSDHFHVEDFEADQRLQLWTGIKWKPKLKPGAVPTVNLPGVGVSISNDCATKKQVSVDKSEVNGDSSETTLADDSRLFSTQNEISVDSVVNIEASIVNGREKCGGNRGYKKPPKKPARAKRDVIYSCSEFELFVT